MITPGDNGTRAPVGGAGGDEGGVKVDPMRVVQRTAAVLGDTVGDFGSRVAMAEEIIAAQKQRIDKYEQQLSDQNTALADKDAELARAHQLAEAYQARIAQLEAPPEGGDLEHPGNAGDDQDAGTSPEEGPGES